MAATNTAAIWGCTVSTIALVWSFWRQSHPVIRLRAKAEMRMADEPCADEVTITVTNLGAVPVTLSDSALVVYPSAVYKYLRVAPEWHNLVRKENPGVKLPKLLLAGEAWKGEVVLRPELLEKVELGTLFFKVYVSHQRPLVGKVRRETLLQLLRK